MILSLGLIVIIAASSFPLHNAERNGNKEISQDVLNKLARGRRESGLVRNRDDVLPQVVLNKLADHLDEKQESVPEASQENQENLNELAQDHVERQDAVDDSPTKTKRANFLDKLVQSGCRKMGKFSILRKLASSSIGRKFCKIPPAPPLPDTAPEAAKLKWYESLGWSSTQADPEDKDKAAPSKENQENLNMLAQDQVERQDAVDDSPNKTKRENFLFNQSVKDKLQNWRKSGCEKVGGISLLKKLTEFVKICKSDESTGVAGPAAVEDNTNAGTGGVLQPIEE